MSGIGKYLKHSVDIVLVTMTKGIRTTVTAEDVPAFITQTEGVFRDEQGDHFGTKTIVFLAGDVDIDMDDELIVDGRQRPIANISKERGLSTEVHHLEVELQ